MDEILISGYYGFKNSGDDALLLSIIEDVQQYRPDANLVVLSGDPAETERIYGVKAISRTNPFEIMAHMRRAKLLLSGGGTLIQDRTSSKSLWYYLGIIALAQMMGLKVMLYSNGIGPLLREGNRKKARRVLNRVDLITLRDETSREELEKIGVTKPKTIVTADPAFHLEPSPQKRGLEILKKAGADTSKRILGISVRAWDTLPEDFARTMAQFSDYASEKYGFHTVFLPMQPSRDTELSQKIFKNLKYKATLLTEGQTIGDMLSVVGCMDVCVGMRLHTLVYAAAGAVPLIGLVYDPKISGFMDYLHQSAYIPVEKTEFKKLAAMLDNTMRDYSSIIKELEKRRELLRKKSELNAKYAIELFDKGCVEL